MIKSPWVWIHEKLTTGVHGLTDYQGRRIQLFNPYTGGIAYKVQLHTHTDESDGADTPTELETAYEGADYDACAITDHDLKTADPSVANILHIDGVEQSSQAGHAQHLLNLFAVAVESLVEDYQQIINEIIEAGALAGLAHPGFDSSGLTELTHPYIKWLENYHFIEIRNSKSGTDDEDKWTALLDANKPVWAIAADDCHDIGGAHFNKLLVMVYAASCTAANLKSSLLNGNFYCKQVSGSTVSSISLSNSVLTVTVGANANFEFLGKGDRNLKTENGVTTSNYTILGNERYVRVRITDVGSSEKAWLQPIWIAPLGGSMGDVPKSPRPSAVNYSISGDQVTIPTGKHARVELDTKGTDGGADFRTDAIFDQEQADGSDCTAVLITDTSVNFQTIRTHANALRYAKVTWSSDAGGTANTGVGYVGATITATALQIHKVSGADFANSYYYTINEAWFKAPVDGQYILGGAVGYKTTNMLADKYFAANVLKNGSSLAGSASHSAVATTQLIVPVSASIVILSKGDLLMLTAYHITGADDIVLRTGFIYTCLSVALLQET